MASKLGGMIAGALGGAAGAAQEQAQGYIKDERELDLRSQLAEIEEQRQRRIADYNEGIRQKGKRADLDTQLEYAPKVTAAEAARESAVTGARATAERDATIAAGNDPKYLAAKKGLVNAARADPQRGPMSPAEELQAMVVADEKRRRQLLDQRAEIESGSMRGDQRTKALTKIDAEIKRLETTRTKGKEDKPEYDEKEVVTTRVDPETGDETKEKTKTKVPRAPAAGAPRDPTKPTEAQAHEQARAAIARGVSKEAVNKRLTENGFKPI